MNKEKINPFKKYEVLKGAKIPQAPKKKTTKTKLSDTELFQTSKSSTVEKVATVAKLSTVAKVSTVAMIENNRMAAVCDLNILENW